MITQPFTPYATAVASGASPWRFVFACALGLLCSNALAADGDPDSTFGINGRAYLGWGLGVPDAADTVAVLGQPDGKVILVGNVNVYSGFDDQDGNPINTNCIGVTRELASGQMDPGFGSNGYFLIDNDPRADHDIHAYAATLDIHGRIMIAGYDNDGPNQRKSAAIWAVKSNGSALDGSFGNGGEYVHDRGVNNSADTFLAIYAANAADIQGGTWNGYIASGINNNGTADLGYVLGLTGTGVVFRDYNVPSNLGGTACSTAASSIAFKTLSAGAFSFYVAGTAVCGPLHFALVSRIIRQPDNNWGSDPAFHSGTPLAFGFSVNAGGFTPSAATSIAFDGANRPVIAGYMYASDLHTPKDMGVARLTTAGTFDATFGSFGTSLISWGDSEYTWVNKVLVQEDGKILLGGNEMLMLSGVPAQSSFALVRLNSNGSRDTGFGNRFGVEGASDYNFPLHGSSSPTPRVAGMAFTEGENILLGGFVQDPVAPQDSYFGVMRIRNGPIVIDDTIFRSGFD